MGLGVRLGHCAFSGFYSSLLAISDLGHYLSRYHEADGRATLQAPRMVGPQEWRPGREASAGALAQVKRVKRSEPLFCKETRSMIERIDHVNLVVNDMPRMIGFYQDALGLQLTKRATISGAWIGAVTGLAQVEAEVAFLEPPAGPAIELICYRTPPGVRPEGQGVANNQGFRHLAFRVEDIDRLVVKMEAAGVRFLSPVQHVPATQVDYADVRKRIVYCRDPEGNLLELCAFA